MMSVDLPCAFYDPDAVCVDPACTRHANEKLRCNAGCGAVICRYSTNSAFAPTGTGNKNLIETAIAKDQECRDNGLSVPMFKCHLCPSPHGDSSFLDQMIGQGAIVNNPAYYGPLPLNATLRPSRKAVRENQSSHGGANDSSSERPITGEDYQPCPTSFDTSLLSSPQGTDTAFATTESSAFGDSTAPPVFPSLSSPTAFPPLSSAVTTGTSSTSTTSSSSFPRPSVTGVMGAPPVYPVYAPTFPSAPPAAATPMIHTSIPTSYPTTTAGPMAPPPMAATTVFPPQSQAPPQPPLYQQRHPQPPGHPQQQPGGPRPPQQPGAQHPPPPPPPGPQAPGGLPQDPMMALMGQVAALLQQNQMLMGQCLQPGAAPAPPRAPAQPHNILNDSILRNVELPKFDGEDISAWPGFYDAFNFRVHRSTYSEVDKFHLLRGLLSGSALQKLDCLDAHQPGAYQEARRVLERNYGDSQDHKGACYKKLYGLPVVPDMELHALESFTDTLSSVVGQLLRLGDRHDTLDSYVHLLWSKLPSQIIFDVQDVQIRNGRSSIPSMGELIDHLSRKVRALRAAQSLTGASAAGHYSGASLLNNASRSTHQDSRAAGSKPKEPAQSSRPANQRQSRRPPEPPRPRVCSYCQDDGSHRSFECERVAKPNERLHIVRKNKLCLNCLSSLHDQGHCGSRSNCRHCNARHHSSLHGADFGPGRRSQRPGNGRKSGNNSSPRDSNRQDKANSQLSAANECKEEGVETEPVNSCVSSARDGRLNPSVMATFEAEATASTTKECVKVNCVIDNGSSYTYVRKALAAQLQLKPLRHLLLDSAACHADTRKRISVDVVRLDLVTKDGRLMPIQALATDKIAPPLHIPAVHIPATLLASLSHLPQGIANLPPSKDSEVNVDILIGSDVAQCFIGPMVPAIPLLPTLSAHVTPFGAILTGSLESGGNKSNSFLDNVIIANSMLNVCENKEMLDNRPDRLEKLLERTTDLEAIGIAKESLVVPTMRDDPLTISLLSSAIRDEDGRFLVCLPFKPGAEHLPTNFGQAFGRAQSTHRRLSTSEREQYYQEFEKRKREGVLEIVDGTQERGDLIHVLPHFPVFKHSSNTTKVRPVVDASAPTSMGGASLNDLLEPGPNLLTNLFQVQLRLRTHRHVVVGDVASAFYGIGVVSRHRDALRIILPKDIHRPLDSTNYQIWRFTRIVMGASPSPWILLAVFTKLAEDAKGGNSYGLSDEELDRLPSSTYMDNICVGYDKKRDGRRIVDGLRGLFASACFHLREFSGSDANAFCVCHLPKEDQIHDRNVKMLGLVWSTTEDVLHLKCPNLKEDKKLTRLSLLSYAHTPFDPIGVAAPLVLAARLLLHDTFQAADAWDDVASPEVHKAWELVRCDLNRISDIHIPRLCVPNRHLPCQMIIFSDANPRAYGFVIYLRQCIGETVSCRLLHAKSRLAPNAKKGVTVTVPRMELWGALIANRAGVFLHKALVKDLDITHITHFIDSQIVLYWLGNRGNLRQYESKRVEEIVGSGLTSDYRYVPTAWNPADHCTKPLSYDKLMASNFLTGPNFLSLPPREWPSWTAPTPDPTLLEGTPPKRRLCVASLLASSNTHTLSPPFNMSIGRFERLNILLGAWCYVNRWMKRDFHNGQTPDWEEREEGMQKWVYYVQRESFPEATAALESGTGLKCKLVKQLGLFLDESGLIRLLSRFANASFERDLKYPLLLPSSHRFTHLLILHLHQEGQHAPATTTLHLLRARFWVPKGPATVRSALRCCFACRFSKGKPCAPPEHGQLPKERVEAKGGGFTSTLADQLGPVYVWDPKTKTESKRWVLLLTCAASRAIHTEVLYDYSAQSVLNAFERFFARRGLTSSTIYLDQAKAFVGATRVVESILAPTFEQKLRSDLQPFARSHKLTFKFSPARSPWVQGAVERMVGLVKQSLRPALFRRKVTDDELHTLVVKVEGMLNTRPLTALSADPEDPRPLTPADLVAPSNVLSLPEAPDVLLPGDPSPMACRLRSSFRKREEILNSFWTTWKREYLQYLRALHLKEQGRRPGSAFCPSVGQICLLADNTPRGTWKCCRVRELHSDQFGVTRYATVQTSTGHQTRRSIAHLIALEVDLLPESKPGLPDPVQDEVRENEFGAGGDAGTAELGEDERQTPRQLRALRRARIREAIFGNP